MNAPVNIARPTAVSIRFIRTVWAWTLLPMFLLGMDQFLDFNRIGPAPKYYYIAWLCSGLLIFFPVGRPETFFRNWLVIWGIGYILLALLWLPLASNAALAAQELVYVMMTFSLVLVACIALPNIPLKSLRAILWFSLIVGVASVIYEIMNPGSLVTADRQGLTTVNIAGRAGGVYLNPTIAGSSILMIALALIYINSQRDVFLIMGIAMLGVLPTFSRAAIAGWVLVMVFFVMNGKLPRSLTIVIVSLIALLSLYGEEILSYFSSVLSNEWSDSLARVEFFLGGGLSDESAINRFNIVQSALNEIYQPPFLGGGLGYSQEWADLNPEKINTHNIYLKHALDFGLIGFIVYPLFLVAALYERNSFRDKGAMVVTLICFFLGVTSHNLMEQAVFVLPMCILSSIDFSKRGT